MYCKGCGDRLPAGVEICPGCGARTGMGKKKKSRFSWRRFWALLPVIITIGSSVLNFAAVGSHEMPPEEAPVSAWAEAPDWEEVTWDYEDEKSEVPASSSSVMVREAVIYDKNGITITTKGYEDTGYSRQFKLLVENNSGRNVMLSCDTFVVNGITVHSSMYIEVKDGKKINDHFELYNDTLEMSGITEVATLSTYNAQLLDPDSYDRIGDLGFEIKTSAAGSHQQKIDDSGELVYDEGGISIAYQKTMDSAIGRSFVLFVKNDSGRDILIQADDVSINDFMVTPCMSDPVCNGTVGYCELIIFEDYFEANNIKQMESMAFVLRFVDPISYGTLYETGELQIQFHQ